MTDALYLYGMNKKVLLLFAVLLLADSLFAQGCSQCRMLADQGSELDADSFGSNINYGILYLMAVPYVLLLFLFRKRVFRVVRALRGKSV